MDFFPKQVLDFSSRLLSCFPKLVAEFHALFFEWLCSFTGALFYRRGARHGSAACFFFSLVCLFCLKDPTTQPVLLYFFSCGYKDNDINIFTKYLKHVPILAQLGAQQKPMFTKQTNWGYLLYQTIHCVITVNSAGPW